MTERETHMDSIELTPGLEYEVKLSKDDPKAPGKVYAGTFHHQDTYALTLVVADRTARRAVVELMETADPDAKLVPGTERDGFRYFAIPQGRIGAIREPGGKWVDRLPTTPAETAAE
jgi:hypothetical protein